MTIFPLFTRSLADNTNNETRSHYKFSRLIYWHRNRYLYSRGACFSVFDLRESVKRDNQHVNPEPLFQKTKILHILKPYTTIITPNLHGIQIQLVQAYYIEIYSIYVWIMKYISVNPSPVA